MSCSCNLLDLERKELILEIFRQCNGEWEYVQDWRNCEGGDMHGIGELEGIMKIANFVTSGDWMTCGWSFDVFIWSVDLIYSLKFYLKKK